MLNSERPPYSPADILAEVVGTAALLTLVFFTFILWPDVPQKIPNHFSFWGVPDSWGLKGLLPTMIYVSVFIIILFTVISRFPRAINFPIKVDEQKIKQHLQLRFSLILWFKTELVLITSYIGIQGMRIALGQTESLGTLFGPIMVLILIGTGAIYIFRAVKLNRNN